MNMHSKRDKRNDPPYACEDGDLCVCSSHICPYDKDLKRLQEQVKRKRLSSSFNKSAGSLESFSDLDSDIDNTSAVIEEPENTNDEASFKMLQYQVQEKRHLPRNSSPSFNDILAASKIVDKSADKRVVAESSSAMDHDIDEVDGFVPADSDRKRKYTVSKSKNTKTTGRKKQCLEKRGGGKKGNDCNSTFTMEKEITHFEMTDSSKVLKESERQPVTHKRRSPRKQLENTKQSEVRQDLPTSGSHTRNKSKTADGVSLKTVKKSRTKNTSNADLGNNSINSTGESNDSNVSIETDIGDEKVVSKNPRQWTKKRTSKNLTKEKRSKKATCNPDSEHFTVVRTTEQMSKCDSDSESLKHLTNDSVTEPNSTETVSRDKSWLNMSLPTPTGGLSQAETFTSLSHSSSSNEDSDSDSDLPEGWTPVICDAKNFAVGDIVWAKFQTEFYLPAIVKHIYKKKKRYTVFYFGPQNEPQLTMAPRCLLPFRSSKKDQIMKRGEQLEKADRDYFFQCIDSMQEFLSKQLKDDDRWSFFKPQKVEVMDTSQHSPEPDNEGTEEVKDSLPKLKSDEQDVEQDVEEISYEKSKKPRIELSKKGKERIERRNEKTRSLTDFLISDTTKDYLKKIFREKIPSELHNKFKTCTIKERMKMKHRGFGPIDDESQIESILDTYFQWIQKWSSNNPYLNKVDYVFDVWIPEAVVYGLMKVKKYTRKRAWIKFDKGVRTTKEELKLIQMEFDHTVDNRASKLTDQILKFKPKKLFLT